MGYVTPPKERKSSPVISEVSGSEKHDDKVLEWREHEFKRMGFVDHVASFLAATRIDLHQMRELLDKGCEHDLACQILMGTMWSGDDPQWRWTDEKDYLDQVEPDPEPEVTAPAKGRALRKRKPGDVL